MARPLSIEVRTCPNCGKMFEVGGRGRPPKLQVYCSHHCHLASREPISHPGSHAPRPRKYKDTLHNESWVRARYLEDQMSLADIAQLIDAPKPTVRWSLHKWGIPVRGSNEGHLLAFDKRGRTMVSQAEMIAAYGGQCACCGEKELRFLSLDHIGGGGSAHRRSFGGNGNKLRQQLKAEGWPTDKYRILCMNCQFGFMHGRTCPHQLAGPAAD